MRWILPSDCEEEEQEEVEGLVSDLIDYVPEAQKLMAAWMAREIGRRIFARFFGSGKFYEGNSVRAFG